MPPFSSPPQMAVIPPGLVLTVPKVPKDILPRTIQDTQCMGVDFYDVAYVQGCLCEHIYEM